jgi:hypothetical protein
MQECHQVLDLPLKAVSSIEQSAIRNLAGRVPAWSENKESESRPAVDALSIQLSLEQCCRQG